MPRAQQLGRYHLLDRIAYGGMAEIFRAKTFDAEGRPHLVAIKRVLAHLVEDEEFLQMLIDEAKVSALLRHENIAQVYEFARAGGGYFLAMEYVDGKDLRSLIEKARQTGRPIPPEHAAWAAMETARALHAAHTQSDPAGHPLRIVHRDVSPSNVLCSYQGEVKLCDFGIAKATLTRIQTKTGVIKGKVKYMSPEQAMGRKLDHRSDLFSLGTVLYECLALAPPFQAASEVELIFAVREARRRPVTDLRADVPPRLVAILDRTLERSRSARPQTGEELAAELRAFLDEYRPGYRRGHFAQYLRHVFRTEIERELRLLEDYVLDEAADAGRVGENLIADALEQGAPFAGFTPLAGGAGAAGLHDEETRLLDRLPRATEPAGRGRGVRPPPPPPLRPDLDAGPTLIDVPGTSCMGDLRELATMIKERSEVPDLHSLETRIGPRPEAGDLHACETRIGPAPRAPAPGASIPRAENDPGASSTSGLALHEEPTRPRLKLGQPPEETGSRPESSSLLALKDRRDRT